MKKRIFGIVLAVVLAAVGTFMLISYVKNAERKAVAGEERVPVLVVDDTVASGEAAEGLGAKVKTELIPAKVEAQGAVANLDELKGMVAAIDLVPGEQLVASRFVTPETLQAVGAILAPADYLEVTISLSPERAMGGELRPGDTVAVFASFEPFALNPDAPLGDAEAVPPDDTGTTYRTPNTTHIILHKVLVTNVQVERLPSKPDVEDAQANGVELAPTGNLSVTLAALPGDLEKLVFTSEYGAVWLARQPASAVEAPTQIQTRETIYR